MKNLALLLFVVLFMGCGIKHSTIAELPCIPSDSIKRVEQYITHYNTMPRDTRGEFIIDELEDKMRNIYIKANGKCDKSALKIYRTTLKYRGIPKNHRQEASLHKEVMYRLAEQNGEFLP